MRNGFKNSHITRVLKNSVDSGLKTQSVNYKQINSLVNKKSVFQKMFKYFWYVDWKIFQQHFMLHDEVNLVNNISRV